MLCELSIRNFAIISDLRIAFQKGLTILSGETGAGKSIIINAVNLLLGGRATAQMIRTGAESAEIEALFRVEPDSQVASALKSYEFEAPDTLLIRRVISRTDRHKLYINGRLSTMQLLKTLTQPLASISGQHAHQSLLKEDQQLLILDQIGGLLSLRKEVLQSYNRLVPLVQKLRHLEAMKNRQQDHIDLLRFQKKEILEADISLKEDEHLEQEISRLRNAAMLYETVHDSIEILYNVPGAVLEKLTEVRKTLDRATAIDADLSNSCKEISESVYKLEDTVEALRSYLQQIPMDEDRLEAAEERLYTLQKLKKKYGGSLENVLKRATSIEKELAGTENLSEAISETKKELSACYDQICTLSEALSRKRHQASKRLSEMVEKELATLKMNRTTFQAFLATADSHSQTEDFLKYAGKSLTETGFETVRFMIAPNVGEDLKPMSEIASGGELSRIVLALKAILAQTDSLETIIFDEVDAGIGGTAAEVVGKKLFQLSQFYQIICITHLPQIAKFGKHQFNIAKSVSAGRTETTIRKLGYKERIEEIARMLGGERITPKTRSHAQEMLAESQHMTTS